MVGSGLGLGVGLGAGLGCSLLLIADFRCTIPGDRGPVAGSRYTNYFKYTPTVRISVYENGQVCEAGKQSDRIIHHAVLFGYFAHRSPYQATNFTQPKKNL